MYQLLWTLFSAISQGGSIPEKNKVLSLYYHNHLKCPGGILSKPMFSVYFLLSFVRTLNISHLNNYFDYMKTICFFNVIK